jgi:hypothetical protein
LPDSTISFVGSIIDSWDRLRENSFHILLQFPTPLPGISSSLSINNVIRWAKTLVLSPRVRESDAGALTFRLIFRKYVLELGVILVFSKESDCLECYTQSTDGDTEVFTSQNPVAQYISFNGCVLLLKRVRRVFPKHARKVLFMEFFSPCATHSMSWIGTLRLCNRVFLK